ncbi:MAG: hypothetical protein EOP94_02375 [Zymomonas sp.]|nr:MAG: hypothetical protein EOP94_02375 [Zymomonas sp.]
MAQTAEQPVAASDSADPQASTQDNAVDDEDGIVVSGLRRSLQTAQAIKKNSDGIVDARAAAANRQASRCAACPT